MNVATAADRIDARDAVVRLTARHSPKELVRLEEVMVVAVVKVAAVGDVAPGTGMVVEAGGKTLALFNLNGSFYALDNTCTHMGGPLGEGDVQGNVVTCPWHGSQFDITTGEVVGPPARRPVAAYRASVESGAVVVEVPDA